MDLGSIPGSASIATNALKHVICPGGEIGRRKGLKIPRGKPRAGSTPALGTTIISDLNAYIILVI